jgi:hypothetical protein
MCGNTVDMKVCTGADRQLGFWEAYCDRSSLLPLLRDLLRLSRHPPPTSKSTSFASSLISSSYRLGSRVCYTVRINCKYILYCNHVCYTVRINCKYILYCKYSFSFGRRQSRIAFLPAMMDLWMGSLFVFLASL